MSENESAVAVAGDLDRWPRALHLLLAAAGAVVVVAGLKAFASTLGPIFLALVLVVVVRPVQDRIARRGWPSWVALLSLLGAAYGVLIFIVASLAWAAVTLVDHIGSGAYTEQIATIQDDARELLVRFGVSGDDLEAAVSQLDIGSVASQLASALSGVLGVASAIGLLVMTMLFMTIDAGRFVGHLDGDVVGQRPEIVNAFRSWASSTRSYFVVSTVFGLIVAVLDVAALLILGVPLALVWGLVSLITNYIPNVGFVLGLVPPALLAFLEGGWQLSLTVVVIYIAINVVIQSIIQPKYVGDAVGFSATLTFLSLIFWGWVFGPLGALLAVPMSLFVKAILVDIDPASRWAGPLVALNNPNKV